MLYSIPRIVKSDPPSPGRTATQDTDEMQGSAPLGKRTLPGRVLLDQHAVEVCGLIPRAVLPDAGDGSRVCTRIDTASLGCVVSLVVRIRIPTSRALSQIRLQAGRVSPPATRLPNCVTPWSALGDPAQSVRWRDIPHRRYDGLAAQRRHEVQEKPCRTTSGGGTSSGERGPILGISHTQQSPNGRTKPTPKAGRN